MKPYPILALLRAFASLVLLLAGVGTIVGSGGGGGGGGEGPAPLVLVAQPLDQQVFDGHTATFTATANNASSYQWQRLSGGTWADVPGATASSYSFTTSLAQTGLQLRVTVSGNNSSINSAPATLTVLEPARIVTQPQDLSLPAGADASLSVVAAGATPSYRWQASSDGGASWNDAVNGSAATLALGAVALADAGRSFRVIVSNGGASVTSRAAALNVYAPVSIVAQPSSASVVDGANASFSVSASQATGYQWQRLVGGAWVDVAGASATTYTFTASLAQSGLQLRVLVSGSGNTVTSNAAVLTVTAATVAPAITAGPQDQTVAVGADASFTVLTSGTSPALRWQSSSNAGASWADVAGGNAATLVVAAPGTTDSGRQYRVIASNSAGSATSRAATLSVLPRAGITAQPLGQTVEDGKTVAFSVTAANATAYQWQRLAGSTWSDIAGATAASYAFTASLAQNGLQLRVVVSNSVSSATSSPAQLTVNPATVPVSITAQPQDAAVIVGNDAAFAVTATGSAPAFRWQSSSNAGLTWADLPNGSGAVFVLPAASEADTGRQFRVIVSNGAGSVTSRAASLNVVVEFIVASGGDACGATGCGSDGGDGGGVGSGDGGGAGAGAGLSAMRKVRATVMKPNGQVLGAANVGADYLVSLYPRAYTGPFIVEFADDGSGQGAYFDEALRQWLPLQAQKLHVMVPTLTHHISANPVTEAAYQYALRQAGSQAALTASAMQQANTLMLTQLNARLPVAYQTNDVTNFVVPISDTSGSGTLTNTWAGRYGAVMAALPIAGALFDSTLPAPALAFTRQLSSDLLDDGAFNASTTGTGLAYGSTVTEQLNVGLCTAVSIWGSPTLPSQFAAQAASAAKAGQLTLLAGSLGGAGNCDGWGANARFNNPWRVAADRNGNVYVADLFNKTVRKISPQGAVQTLAGSPGKQGTADGLGLAARFTSPHSIAVDANDFVYVGDGGAIRRISPLGLVSTLAGSVTEHGYADGSGASARLGSPEDLAVDNAGNVYVADSGFFVINQGSTPSLRKVTPAGVVSTLATECGGSSLNVPAGVAVDASNNVYIANTGNREICKLTPSGASSLLVRDGAGLQEPRGLAVDGAGNVYIADSFNEVVRKLTPAGALSTLAGGLEQRGNADGAGSSARFRRPNGVAVDGNGNVYVADEENHTIRKISAGGTVTTLAGLGPDFGYADGTGGSARFYGPSASVADTQGNVYVVDSYNYVIRKITAAGVVTTLAGAPGQPGFTDGSGSAARFKFDSNGAVDTVADRSPIGLTIDGGGNLYVAERGNDAIRKVTPQGLVTTVATAVGFPDGIAVDAGGNLFVSTLTGIRRITPAGINTAFASVGGSLAIDAAGNLYAASAGAYVVRKITPSGSVSILAGVVGSPGTVDGTGAAARFQFPVSVAIDTAGNVYVAENRVGFETPTQVVPEVRVVRRITPAGVVSTVVGKVGSVGNIVGALPASLGLVSSVSVVGPSQIAITSDDGVFLATFP